MNKISEIIKNRQEKLDWIKESKIDPFPNNFIVSHSINEILNEIKKSEDTIGENSPFFSTAGRMISINKFGKSSFIRFRDRTAQIQAYIRQDKVGKETYTLFKKLDIGDFVGIKGKIFATKTGEWTIVAESLQLLSKSMQPLPEKFHGLKDPEIRYRQRYLDLIMNENVRNTFISRSKIIQTIRDFLIKKEYLEVETPMMQPLAGGAEATPFVTHHNALGIDLYLRIAPELYLKRLVIGGFERVFEINRNFRNEGVSTKHNPEFTMLEFYQAYATYHDLMDITMEMFTTVALSVCGTTSIDYQGETIEFDCKWKQIPLLKAIETIGGVDPKILNNKDALLTFASENNIKITKADRIGKILTKIFDIMVEPKLIQPTFITEYPVEVSPLSKRSEKDPSVTERFELFIAGKEIANGFSELNDPDDQKERFLQQAADRDAGDNEAHVMDENYIEALKYGMPPTAGEGIGIDRLAMILTNSASIREVILFPHMKPSGK